MVAEHSPGSLSWASFLADWERKVEGSLLDNGNLSPNAHPWALQLKADLQSLEDIELGGEFIQALQGNMRKLVMDENAAPYSVTLTSGNSE